MVIIILSNNIESGLNKPNSTTLAKTGATTTAFPELKIAREKIMQGTSIRITMISIMLKYNVNLLRNFSDLNHILHLGYKFKDHSECKGRYITSRHSIIDAKRACTRDKTCGCITNEECDNKSDGEDDKYGDFNLYTGGAVRSHVGCSWNKKGILFN